MTLNKEKKEQDGFTLIETLIYLAIIGAVMTSFLYFGLSVFDYRNKSYVAEEVQANERMVINLISQKIRSAKDVNVASSTFNINPGFLSLVMAEASKNPTIFSLSQNDGILQITEGTGTAMAVTSKNVKVSSLIFTNLTLASTTKNIKINMTIDYNNRSQDIKFNYSDDLETAVSLRR